MSSRIATAHIVVSPMPTTISATCDLSPMQPFWRVSLNSGGYETSGRHDVLTVRNSMSWPISAAFGKGSGRARDTLKTQTGGLENPDGRSGRAQAELGAEECTRRRRSSHIDALLTVPITASCWAGVVDKAGATMSETCQ